VARRFAADGHRVAILDRQAADAAAKELAVGGAVVIGVSTDVADRASVAAAFAAVRADLGPVEILVTSAGVESFQSVLDITAESEPQAEASEAEPTIAAKSDSPETNSDSPETNAKPTAPSPSEATAADDPPPPSKYRSYWDILADSNKKPS